MRYVVLVGVLGWVFLKSMDMPQFGEQLFFLLLSGPLSWFVWSIWFQTVDEMREESRSE
jgi:hypothetical protein